MKVRVPAGALALALAQALGTTSVANAQTQRVNDVCAGSTPASELVAAFETTPPEQRADWLRALRRAVRCDASFASSVPALVQIVPRLDEKERSRIACSYAYASTEHVMDPVLLPLAHDESAAVRACAVRTVMQNDPSKIPLGVTALSDPAPEVRQSAAQALSTLAQENEDARRALADAVEDPRPEVRKAALGVLAYTEVQGIDESRLTELLSDPDLDTRLNAAAALARTGKSVDQALPVLIASLASSDPEQQGRAAAAIGQLGPKGAPAAQALADALGRADKQRAQMLASALGQLGEAASSVTPALVKLLADPERAPAALSALGSVAKDLTPAVPALIELLRHGAPEAQSTALDVLTKAGPAAAPAVDELVRIATTELPKPSGRDGESDGDPEDYRRRAVRAGALRTLAAIGPKAKEALPKIEKLLSSDDPRVVELASEAYTKLGGDPKKLTARWIHDLASSDADTRKRALDMLAQSDGDDRKAALPGVKAALADPSPEVREAAGHALWSIDHDPDEIVALTATMAKDSDPKVRAAAIRVASGAAPSVLIRSKSWVIGLLDDPDPEVRRTAVGTLDSLRGAAAEAVPKLVQMLESGDQELFTQVLFALQMMGPAAAPALPALEEQKSKGDRYRAEMIARAIEQIRKASGDATDSTTGKRTPADELALAQALVQKGDTVAARAAFQRAVDGFHAQDEKANEARARDELAIFLDTQGKKDEAREELEKAASLFHAADDKSSELAVTLQLAAVDREQGRTDEARAAVEKARELAKGLGNPDLEGAALIQLAGLAVDTGERDQARQYLLEAQKLFQKSGNGLGEGAAMMSLGGLELMRSRFEPARIAFDTARQLFQQADDPLREGLAVFLWSHLDVALGNWDEAERRIDAARGLFERAHDRRFEAKAWWMRASTLSQRGGRAKDARAAAQRALDIARGIPDDESIAHALVALAELDMRDGQTQEAIAGLSQAREAAIRSHQDLAAAIADAGLAQLAFRMGNVSEAAAALARTNETATRLKNREIEAFVDLATAEMELSFGHPAKVESALDGATAAATDLANERLHAEIDSRRAGLAWRRGRFHEARATLARTRGVLQRFHRSAEESELLRALAELELEAGKPGAAKDASDGALALARARQSPELEADAAAIVATIERSAGHYSAARDALGQARSFYEKADHYRGLGRTQLELGRLEARLGHGKEAQAALDAARTTCALYPIPECEADALVTSAALRLDAGRADTVGPDLARAMTLYQDIERPAGVARATARLGDADRLLGNAAEARHHYEDARGRFQTLGIPAGEAEVLLGLGRLESSAGNAEAARAAFDAAHARFQQLGDPAGEADAERALAELTGATDRARGKALLAEVAKTYDKLGLGGAAAEARAEAAKLGAK